MVKQFDAEFRKSEQYKSWVDAARLQYPLLPDSLIDLAIASHFGNPLAYREKKSKTPTTIPKSSTEEVVLNAVTIEPPSETSIAVQEIETDAKLPMA